MWQRHFVPGQNIVTTFWPCQNVAAIICTGQNIATIICPGQNVAVTFCPGQNIAAIICPVQNVATTFCTVLVLQQPQEHHSADDSSEGPRLTTRRSRGINAMILRETYTSCMGLRWHAVIVSISCLFPKQIICK